MVKDTSKYERPEKEFREFGIDILTERFHLESSSVGDPELLKTNNGYDLKAGNVTLEMYDLNLYGSGRHFDHAASGNDCDKNQNVMAYGFNNSERIGWVYLVTNDN